MERTTNLIGQWVPCNHGNHSIGPRCLGRPQRPGPVLRHVIWKNIWALWNIYEHEFSFDPNKVLVTPIIANMCKETESAFAALDCTVIIVGSIFVRILCWDSLLGFFVRILCEFFGVFPDVQEFKGFFKMGKLDYWIDERWGLLLDVLPRSVWSQLWTILGHIATALWRAMVVSIVMRHKGKSHLEMDDLGVPFF